jgi:hypothetical protein
VSCERSTDDAPVARRKAVGQVLCVRGSGAGAWLSFVRFVQHASVGFSSAFLAVEDISTARADAPEKPDARRAAKPIGATSRARRAVPITAIVKRLTAPADGA